MMLSKADIKSAASVFAGECEQSLRPPLLWGNPDTDVPTHHLESDGTKKQLAELRLSG
jgi:hypothetical protein